MPLEQAAKYFKSAKGAQLRPRAVFGQQPVAVYCFMLQNTKVMQAAGKAVIVDIAVIDNQNVMLSLFLAPLIQRAGIGIAKELVAKPARDFKSYHFVKIKY